MRPSQCRVSHRSRRKKSQGLPFLLLSEARRGASGSRSPGTDSGPGSRCPPTPGVCPLVGATNGALGSAGSSASLLGDPGQRCHHDSPRGVVRRRWGFGRARVPGCLHPLLFPGEDPPPPSTAVIAWGPGVLCCLGEKSYQQQK